MAFKYGLFSLFGTDSGELYAKDIQICIIQPIRGEIPPIYARFGERESQIMIIRPVWGSIPPICARLANGVSNNANSAYSGFDYADLCELWLRFSEGVLNKGLFSLF